VGDRAQGGSAATYWGCGPAASASRVASAQALLVPAAAARARGRRWGRDLEGRGWGRWRLGVRRGQDAATQGEPVALAVVWWRERDWGGFGTLGGGGGGARSRAGRVDKGRPHAG